ncbi:nuclear transport factor 2 family protein [Myxococcus stipitatus]|uniref:YybH family protein n=1 Tax=Myxococcus stipitatus TaxID=83455 RepID=UPI001F46EA81|nr:nuclear transport factor 2 family protein [Myxococcus stipitatus]MCE9673319.1 nuclear transport factor 2 family protein [Myxococcus stipitatus]
MSDDEVAIRELIARWVDAIRAGELAAVLAPHPEDVVLFDVTPPLEARGLAAYRRHWEPFLLDGPHEDFELGGLRLVVGDTVAFAHASVKLSDGPDFAVRLTLGLEKRGGRWWLVHEHHSAPVGSG